MTAKPNSDNAPSQLIINQIRELTSFLIVSHVNPDGDAIGSSLAMGRYLTCLGKQVIVMLDSPVPDVYRFLPDADGIYQPDLYNKQVQVEAVISLECPNKGRMGKVNDKLSGHEFIICIDHHLDSIEYGKLNWIDTSYSSVGEMLWALFKQAGFELDNAVAEQLYTAVMTDTGRFRFDNTSPRTMLCASELIAAGAQPDKISREVYYTTLPSTMILRGLVLSSIRFEADNRICHISLTNKMLEQAGADKTEAEGLIDSTLFSRGVELGAMFKEDNDSVTRVSLRSVKRINVARIAKEYGGGGHFNAAGVDFNGPVHQARDAIVKRLKEALDESA